MAAQVGVGIDALAMAAARARPWADVVLSRAGTPDQLRSNLAALAIRWDDQAGERTGKLTCREASPPSTDRR
jgi:aryl-alcohol dehydrogenase-like predicted oxidoreductase